MPTNDPMRTPAEDLIAKWREERAGDERVAPMTRKDLNTYVLSTGRKVDAHLGIIGLSHQTGEDHYPNLGGPQGWTAIWGEPNVGRFQLAEGFDGPLYCDEWTPAERAELADFMIEQWQRFKAATADPPQLRQVLSQENLTAASAPQSFAQSFDARDWARAFVEHVKVNPNIATDEGAMIGWFANAIMRGYDEYPRRNPPSDPPQP